MTTNVYYTSDNLKKVLDSMCECGHKLSNHGFVDAYVHEYSSSHLRVSQCVSCGLEKCKEFKQVTRKDKE